ncbi:MAG: cytochrome c [bacterium]|nr:cytochrome c [bacterium]
MKSPKPRLHIVQDMDNQGRFKSQQANAMFADGRAMRPPVAGTVAREMLREDETFYRGIAGSDYVTELPVTVNMDLLQRGKQRFEIYCSPCHGLAGYGDGIVARRADRLQQGTWVPPSSLHAAPASTRPPGHIFNTITNGIRTMPAYGSQIPVEDRWAIVAYTQVLRRSQQADLSDVPPAVRSSLR